MPISVEPFAPLHWPRGLCFRNDTLHVLSRGRPRGAGGPHPNIADDAGRISKISPTGEARTVATPTDPPFRLWNPQLPNHADIETDRPYATLVWHEESENFFICGFSGIDAPTGWGISFRKNASDSILRYDTRSQSWHDVERHDASVVPQSAREGQTQAIDNSHFPSAAAPPRGWLNGPDGLMVHENSLYAVGKDNHSLVKYDLTSLVTDSATGPLPSTLLRKDGKDITLPDGSVEPIFDGPSALAYHDDTLFVGLRSVNLVIGMSFTGGVVGANQGWKIVVLPNGSQIIDLATDSTGALLVCTKLEMAGRKDGAVWRVPDPASGATFTATNLNVHARIPGTCSNIAIDGSDRLYVCSNDKCGTIYRQA